MGRLSHVRRQHPLDVTEDGETGASMMLALVLMITIFSILTGVLSFGFTAARTVDVYDRDRALHYNADAALELAIQMVRNNPRMGETSYAGLCELTYAMSRTPASPADPELLFAQSSSLLVECQPTPGITVTSGGTDPATGRQRYRDVTFTVSCHYDSLASSSGELDCQPWGFADVMVLGTARVRYDVDPGHTVPADAARVPKIVSWQLDR